MEGGEGKVIEPPTEDATWKCLLVDAARARRLYVSTAGRMSS